MIMGMGMDTDMIVRVDWRDPAPAQRTGGGEGRESTSELKVVFEPESDQAASAMETALLRAGESAFPTDDHWDAVVVDLDTAKAVIIAAYDASVGLKFMVRHPLLHEFLIMDFDHWIEGGGSGDDNDGSDDDTTKSP